MTAPGPSPKASRAGRVTRIALGSIVSGAFVALAIWSLGQRGVTMEDVWAGLTSGHYEWVAVYVVVLLVLTGLRVVRWGMLVRGIGRVGWRKITAVSLLGQAAIGIFPMRLGEAVRPILIVEPGQVDLGQATATVVVERIADGVLVGLLFIATLWFLRDMTLPPEFKMGAWATSTLFGGMAVFFILVTLLRQTAVQVVWRLVKPISPGLGLRLAAILESFLGAIRAIARGRRSTWGFLGVTVLLWLVNGLSLMPIFWAFDIDQPAIASFAILCVMVVGYMIPAGPGATGTLNYAIILAMTAFGVSQSVTGALAILLYVLILVVNVVVGVIGLWIGGFSLSSVVRASREPSGAHAAAAAPDVEGRGDDDG